MSDRILSTAGIGALVGATSLALLLGALAFQYLGGLPPCQMCHWQRWPHIAAAAIGLGGALLLPYFGSPRHWGLAVAVLAILGLGTSGLIGLFHAGVEWMWWTGPTACTGLGFVPGALDDPNAFRVVRCDVAPWELFGISLAGYNALISLGAAGLATLLLLKKGPR